MPSPPSASTAAALGCHDLPGASRGRGSGLVLRVVDQLADVAIRRRPASGSRRLARLPSLESGERDESAQLLNVMDIDDRHRQRFARVSIVAGHTHHDIGHGQEPLPRA